MNFRQNLEVGRARPAEPLQNAHPEFDLPGRTCPAVFSGPSHVFQFVVLVVALCAWWSALGGMVYAGAAEADKPWYQNDFEKSAVGSVPEDLMVLAGDFKVGADGGNKILELPGAPLETFGVLFGPTEKDGIAVSARIFGTRKGRRSPSFGVGLGGLGGFKLQVSPAKGLIELSRGDEMRKSVPYEWPAGKWIQMRLELRKSKSDGWTVIGKVWAAVDPEPKQPTITWEEKSEPTQGRASIWGSPFSGTPIRYDDLAVVRLSSPQ